MTRGSGRFWVWLRFLGTLRAGEGVLRPCTEPALTVHLALPAPLVSEVVYVKIKPLETDACPCLGENLRTPGVWPDQAHPRPRPCPFSPIQRGGAGICRGAAQRKPRPWRQLRFWIRFWIRQWPADPQVPDPGSHGNPARSALVGCVCQSLASRRSYVDGVPRIP